MHVKSLLIVTTAAAVFAVASAQSQVVQPTPSAPGDYVLPDGGAKKLVEDNCTICHNLRNVVNSNKSAEDWDNTVNMMMAAGAPITRIVLTHGHGDHVGSLDALKEQLGPDVEVYLGDLDARIHAG